MELWTDPVCSAVHTAKKIARLCYVPTDAAALERAGVKEQLTEEEKKQRKSPGALNLLQKKLRQDLKGSEDLQLWEVSLPEHFRAWDMAAKVHDAFIRLRQYGWRVQWRAKLIEIFRDAVEVDADSLEKAIRAEATAPGGPQGKRPSCTVDEANAAAMKLAKQDAGFVHNGIREWAAEISKATDKTCSTATVKKTALWITTMEQTGRGRQKGIRQSRPQAVSLIESAVGEGQRDEVLSRLAKEQADDFEPSPLDEDSSDEPRRVRCRKRV